MAGDTSTVARDYVLSLWIGKPALVFGAWDIDHPAGAHTCLVWDKGDWPGMGNLSLPWGPSHEEIYALGHGFVGVGPRTGSVIRLKRMTGSTNRTTVYHPSAKPVGLLRTLMGWLPPNATIIDPFMGSGPTLVAAKQLGRKAIGIEIEERYCALTVKRLGQECLVL